MRAPQGRIYMTVPAPPRSRLPRPNWECHCEARIARRSNLGRSLTLVRPERDDRRRAAVHDPLDLGMGLVDLAVNKSFKINGPARRVDCIAVAIEFHEVGGGN